MRTILLLSLTLWTLGGQTRDASIAISALGQVYDASAASLLVFTGTPGTARVTVKTHAAPDGRCIYGGPAAQWFCVSAEGQVSVSASDGSSSRALDVPAGPSALIVSGSGSALALWYADLHQLYVVTGAGSTVRMMQPTAPVAQLLAVSDDGALALARGDDACAWLLAPDETPRCVQNGDGDVTGAFAPERRVLLAYRQSGKVYVARAGDSTAQLIAGPADGIVEPVAVLAAGSHAYVADRGAGVIHAIDLETGTIRAIPSPAQPSQFLPVGRELYLTTGLASGSLILLETGPAARIAAATLAGGGAQ
ncbi:MAG: hypothetical protein WBY44_18925 [Bryobacteraceae bacterium]|jgi:hypothetical protein